MDYPDKRYPRKSEDPYPEAPMLPPEAPTPFPERNKVPKNPEETREEDVKTPGPPRSPNLHGGRPGYCGPTPEEFNDTIDNADLNDGNVDDTDVRVPPGSYDQLPY